jgi:hypothetical protein
LRNERVGLGLMNKDDVGDGPPLTAVAERKQANGQFDGKDQIGIYSVDLVHPQSGPVDITLTLRPILLRQASIAVVRGFLAVMGHGEALGRLVSILSHRLANLLAILCGWSSLTGWSGLRDGLRG